MERIRSSKSKRGFKPSRLAVVIAAAFVSNLSISQGLHAQEATTTPTQAPQEDEVVEVIEVSGIRSSIEGALLEKRASDVITDGISADYICNFPDLNLGEALQRIPGVQIDRENSRL